MNRILVVAALIAGTSAMPLGAQGRSQAAPRPIEILSRNPGQGRATPADSRANDRDRENDRARANDRARGNDRDSDDRDDRDRNGRYERRDRDGTRVFIDRNGLECVEKSSVKNGRRSYDLKCREPKRNNGRSVLPPPRGQDRSRACVDANRDGRCDGVGMGRRYPDSASDRVGAILGQDRQGRSWLDILTDRTGGR